MKRRDFIAGGAAALGLGGWWLTSQMGTKEPSNLLVGMANAQQASGDPSTITDMVLGDENAPVQVIEYASFTCPHCASFHADLMPRIKADYIDTGKVRFTYREVYFDRFGLWASMVARCGGDMRFFAIADLIYENQRAWTSSGDPSVIVGELRKFGKLAGLDDATLDVCMQDADMAQSLVTWYEENAAADDVRSTPTFVINGTKFEGNWSSGLIPAIDAAL